MEEDSGVFKWLTRTFCGVVGWLSAMGTVGWMDKVANLNADRGAQTLVGVIGAGICIGLGELYSKSHNN